MGVSGLDNGRKQSSLKPGLKGGRLLSPMRSGMGSGLNNGIMNRRNMQDPLLLIGADKPIAFWNAENCTVNASNNLLTVTNLAPGSVETFTVGSDPNRVSADIYGGKAGVVFDSTDYVVTSPILSSKTEATVFLVASPTSAANQYICYFLNSTISSTIGDFYITANSGVLTANMLGNPTSTNNTIVSKPIDTLHYYIITLKLRITKTGKDAFEMYIDGTKQSNYTVSTYTAGTSFTDTGLYFGGNPSQTLGGNSIGTGIVFDYYLSDTQQLRIENYLRWYYGRNF